MLQCVAAKSAFHCSRRGCTQNSRAPVDKDCTYETPLVLFPGTPLLVISRTMIARHDRSHELVYLGGQTSHRASCHGPCNSWPRCFPDSLGHCTLDLAYQVVVEFASSLRSTIRFSQYEGQAVVALAAFVSLNSIWIVSDGVWW